MSAISFFRFWHLNIENGTKNEPIHILFNLLLNKYTILLKYKKRVVVRRVFSYFKILCFINRMDPDEMPHFVQSHPSLYCL